MGENDDYDPDQLVVAVRWFLRGTFDHHENPEDCAYQRQSAEGQQEDHGPLLTWVSFRVANDYMLSTPLLPGLFTTSAFRMSGVLYANTSPLHEPLGFVMPVPEPHQEARGRAGGSGGQFTSCGRSLGAGVTERITPVRGMIMGSRSRSSHGASR